MYLTVQLLKKPFRVDAQKRLHFSVCRKARDVVRAVCGVYGYRLSKVHSAACSRVSSAPQQRPVTRAGLAHGAGTAIEDTSVLRSRECVCACVCVALSPPRYFRKKKKRLSLREHSRRRCYRDSTSLAHKTCHRWLPELFRQRLTQVPVDRVMHQSVVWPFVFPAGTVESQCGAKAVRLSPSSCACGSLWELISSGVEACRQGSPGPNLETFATQQTTDDERQT